MAKEDVIKKFTEENGYESPVLMFFENDVFEDMKEVRENAVTCFIREKLGVSVDKDELLRALAYDRDQYNKGFLAGYKQGIEEGREILAEQVRKALEKRVIHVDKVGDENG